MSYSITYSKSAAKAFKRIHPQERQRLKEAIEALGHNPRPPGCIHLEGGSGEVRIRVGSYRIVYDIEDDELVILILRPLSALKGPVDGGAGNAEELGDLSRGV